MQLEYTIDRFEGDKAVLKSKTDTIIWPKKDLPADTREGSVVFIEIKTSESKERENKKLAKDILNEILGN